MARKKKIAASHLSPEALAMRQSALKRTHRQVIYLNDSELAAVKEYCGRYGVKSMSTIFREATIERILSEMDDSHPTLF